MTLLASRVEARRRTSCLSGYRNALTGSEDVFVVDANVDGIAVSAASTAPTRI